MESTPPLLRSPRQGLLLTGGLLLALTACGGSSGSGGSTSPNSPGESLVNPETGDYFLVDTNEGGLSQTPRVLRLAWGRLVRVFGLASADPSGPRVVMHRNFLINPSLISGQGLLLETNGVTGEETLTILENVNDPSGLNGFFNKLRAAEQSLAPVFDAGSSGVGFFTMMPRNAALMIQLDDLIDADTLDATTVKLLTGVPPLLPFESRIFADPNHGDLAAIGSSTDAQFYTTRVIIDPTISQLEAFESDPPQPVNGLGLPPSQDVNLSNVEIRIPTRIVAGTQEVVLTNPTDHPLTTASNGTIDFNSPTRDLVRALRSGGPTDVTNDPFNGFLPDSAPPRIVGVQSVDIDASPILVDGRDFVLPSTTFASIFCSETPVVGDVIAQPQIGVFAEVRSMPLPVNTGVVQNLAVRLLVFPSAWGIEPEEWIAAGVGPAQLLSSYAPGAGDQAACFVQVAPLAQGWPEQPTTNVFTSSTFTVRFSEPMDPRSMTAFDAFTVQRTSTPMGSTSFVSGEVQGTQDLQQFTFLPSLPLAHASGSEEPYFVGLSDGPLGATDLAGNRLGQTFSEERLEPGAGGPALFPNVRATLLSSAATQLNGGRVSRFTSADEDPPFAMPGDPPLAEWSGQHTYDAQNQALRPRPVVRTQALADRQNFMIAPMTPSMSGVQSPVSNLGSKTHFIWRFMDVGFDLVDATNYNMDVEGLNWAPFGGEVVVDTYPEYEMRLSHAAFLPDELLNPLTQLPVFPNSGLLNIFDNNLLNEAEDPQRIVHARNRGYAIHPGNIFVVGQNVRMLPFPLNRDLAPTLFRYYTWRDTSLQSRAGPNGFGGPTSTWYLNQGLPTPITGDCLLAPVPNPFYDPGQIQSVGLPLLMEFRCFPANGANGINRFDTSLAINTSTRPFFRAFSEGGIDTSQNIVLVDPDLESEANGGFNPMSVPVPGATTGGRDQNVYIGGMDLVVRVSRSFSVWQQTTNPLGSPAVFIDPDYFPPTVEPRAADQPSGTSVTLHFRGATLIDPAESEVLQNARELDAYGDHYTEIPSPCDGSIDHNPDTLNLDISFLNGDMRWFPGISSIDGAQYYQVRVTFVSNTVSGLSPRLKAVAINWTD